MVCACLINTLPSNCANRNCFNEFVTQPARALARESTVFAVSRASYAQSDARL
jgi:hypothetical protein